MFHHPSYVYSQSCNVEQASHPVRSIDRTTSCTAPASSSLASANEPRERLPRPVEWSRHAPQFEIEEHLGASSFLESVKNSVG